MRIISGKYRGKRFVAPKNLPVRPTSDMHKEALFNILANRYDFEDLKVADLFSGTGNIAYEFASRGAPEIICVDAHPACVRYIARTSKEMDFPVVCVKSDVVKYLQKTHEKFDIIFADPPYDFSQGQLDDIVRAVVERELLLPGGSLIVEHSKNRDFSENQYLTESRTYGGSVFSFFQVL